MSRKLLLVSIFSAVIVAGLWASAGLAPIAPRAFAGDTYEIDASHTTVLFAIEHLGIGRYYGRFNGIEGALNWDADNPETSSLTAKVATATVDTANSGRDRHLRNQDFFDAGQFPYIEFDSTKLTSKADDRYELQGVLRMLGVTKPILFSLEKIGAGTDPWGNDRVGFEARGTLKRSDFNMNYGLNNGALGDEVELIIAFEATRKKE